MHPELLAIISIALLQSAAAVQVTGTARNEDDCVRLRSDSNMACYSLTPELGSSKCYGDSYMYSQKCLSSIAQTGRFDYDFSFDPFPTPTEIPPPAIQGEPNPGPPPPIEANEKGLSERLQYDIVNRVRLGTVIISQMAFRRSDCSRYFEMGRGACMAVPTRRPDRGPTRKYCFDANGLQYMLCTRTRFPPYHYNLQFPF
ncbi:hypothetical protein HDU67_001288 [Dinochytrium kinnereticum]|nr:hypothetical protein HDU67_001288 [Dinochytrium kinnereticum]